MAGRRSFLKHSVSTGYWANTKFLSSASKIFRQKYFEDSSIGSHVSLLHHVTIYTDKSDMIVSSKGPTCQSFLKAEDTELVWIHGEHIRDPALWPLDPSREIPTERLERYQKWSKETAASDGFRALWTCVREMPVSRPHFQCSWTRVLNLTGLPFRHLLKGQIELFLVHPEDSSALASFANLP